MNHKRPPVPAIIVAILLVIVSVYFIVTQVLRDDTSTLVASGTIEATIVNVSPEMSGKVKEVLVEEGQPVKAGDPIIVLDDSLLAAQRAVAQSGVDSAQDALLTAESALALAQAQYDSTVTAARAQEGAQRLSDWDKRTPDWFEQPNWYFSREEQIAAAQANVDSAKQRLDEAQTNLDKVTKNLENADFIAAETRLANARTNYTIEKTLDSHAQMTGGKVSPEDVDVHIPARVRSTYRVKIAIAHDMSGESDILNVSQDSLDAATTELDDAEKEYEDLLDTKAADHVLEARAELSVAQERYDVARDTLTQLQTGEYSPQVRIASIGLEQAKAGVQQAESAVQQAKANLALLDTQMSKLTVYAPTDGVVLTRNVEPGEFVQPGGVALSLADLGNITITVYVPEDRYGQISVGRQAQITADSFPDETFTGEVIHMADRAEFTPRNIQTVEGRSSTVFAIKLKVNNSEGKLKIGMPADVVFK
ncbi:MAG TPA: efflux RND transporter periplasmic adaptor subunit [Anaerolineales bacterium]|nr:efflux RND transporter periplasmic adaptor subunit [Anaerolineales bacterium]